ncbi:hypothetical protein EG329_002009 [Mollisiaceae sp. DMI_Dod_QoI]|nr:hypothetical protein EG329_002009 [Helotiales sp. DMI_Dod_QoI]
MRTRSTRVSRALDAWVLPPEPPRYPKRSKKTPQPTLPPDHSPTTEDISAIPAKCFPKFRALPIELQKMIWDFAMPDTFIEVSFSNRKTQFRSCPPKAQILPTSESSRSKYKLFPIYLIPAQHLFPFHFQRIFNGSLAAVTTNALPLTMPLYIQSKDILYIPEIHNIDIDAFLKREENHAIENLAIHASSALRLGWDLNRPNPSHELKALDEGKLVRGLKNLKNLYIVEGQNMGAERRVFRGLGEEYSFSWSKVKEGPEVGKTDSDGIFRRNYRHEWNTGVIDSIAQAVSTEVEMMARKGKNWNPPQLIFRELRRTLIEE